MNVDLFTTERDGSWTELGLLAEPEIKRDQPMAGDAVVTGLARVDG